MNALPAAPKGTRSEAEAMPASTDAQRDAALLAAQTHFTAAELDLDAQIAAAELRVLQRDMRVLRQGALLKQRLASQGTQLRLAGMGAVAVTAITLLMRKRHKSEAKDSQQRGGSQRAGNGAASSWWVQWVPLVVQVAMAGRAKPAHPPGMVGLAFALLSGLRRRATRAEEQKSGSGLSAAAPERQVRQDAPFTPRELRRKPAPLP